MAYDCPPYKLLGKSLVVPGALTYRNGIYTVTKYLPVKFPGVPCDMVQLSYSRVDRGHEQDFRDRQHMKNQLVGPECEAVELFPAESRLMDTANQFHLWCLVSRRHHFPFGIEGGRAVTDEMSDGSTQRPGSGATPEEEQHVRNGLDHVSIWGMA